MGGGGDATWYPFLWWKPTTTKWWIGFSFAILHGADTRIRLWFGYALSWIHIGRRPVTHSAGDLLRLSIETPRTDCLFYLRYLRGLIKWKSEIVCKRKCECATQSVDDCNWLKCQKVTFRIHACVCDMNRLMLSVAIDALAGRTVRYNKMNEKLRFLSFGTEFYSVQFTIHLNTQFSVRVLAARCKALTAAMWMLSSSLSAKTPRR